MPKPTNHDQFYDEWHSFRLEMAGYMAKSESKQEQTDKDLESLRVESEKSKKFRHKAIAAGATVTTGGILTAIKAFFGLG